MRAQSIRIRCFAISNASELNATKFGHSYMLRKVIFHKSCKVYSVMVTFTLGLPLTLKQSSFPVGMLADAMRNQAWRLSKICQSALSIGFNSAQMVSNFT